MTIWNPGAERLYGYRAEVMIGESFERIVPPERRAEEMEVLARIAHGERIEPYTTERVGKDGVVIPVALSVSPIADSTGVVVGVASAARDIGGASAWTR